MAARRRKPSDPRSGPSKAWNHFLRESGNGHSIVPNGGIVPLTGEPGWTPDHEVRSTGTCPTCQSVIAAGSILYCPRCALSGFEARLADQRSLKPMPRREPPVYVVRAKPKSKKSKVAGRKGRRAA